MDLLEAMFGEKKPSEELKTTGAPFTISTKFVPRRLSSRKEDKMQVLISVKNNTSEDQLVSLDFLLPSGVTFGFDPTGIGKKMEKRLGHLAPGETKETTITVWGNNQTKEGEYPLKITAFSHYLDYNKVLNYIERTVSVRVV